MALPIPGRVAEALRRSTVQITTAHVRGQGSGSGTVLTGERVVTNAHVICGEALTVESWEGKQLRASLLKIDRKRDLALLTVPRLNASSGELRDSNQVQVGMPVVAVGNPLGFTGAVSSGVVHQIGALYPYSGRSWIQADVRLAPGNSGGPLADFEGRIIGINTMVISGGLALAIPSRTVQAFLSTSGTERHLGVVIRPVRIRNGSIGMMILEIVPDGAADAASLLPGDVLVSANDTKLRSADDLQTAIETAPGSILRLEFYRARRDSLRRVVANLAVDRALSAA